MPKVLMIMGRIVRISHFLSIDHAKWQSASILNDIVVQISSPMSLYKNYRCLPRIEACRTKVPNPYRYFKYRTKRRHCFFLAFAFEPEDVRRAGERGRGRQGNAMGMLEIMCASCIAIAAEHVIRS